jgi:hypothetical protein
MKINENGENARKSANGELSLTFPANWNPKISTLPGAFIEHAGSHNGSYVSAVHPESGSHHKNMNILTDSAPWSSRILFKQW